MTPIERTLRARIGAYSLHAAGKTNTGPCRKAFMARFDREVDPEGVLPQAERHKRAEAAKKLYFARLALKSAQARNHKKARQSKAGHNPHVGDEHGDTS
jgi:hypothetical protein